MLKSTRDNRFQTFFEHDIYLLLKNYLYNYLLRKITIKKHLAAMNVGSVLEIGSGVSPVVTHTGRIVYSDLSFTAMRYLKQKFQKGRYVAADAMHLPFRSGSFSHIVCSEVLEHLADDGKALKEISRILSPSGVLILTVPHREKYYWNDDRFADHYRRYELVDLVQRLTAVGLTPVLTQKVLGPLEKFTMAMVVFFIERFYGFGSAGKKEIKNATARQIVEWAFKYVNRLYMCLAWIDARLWPVACASVLLIKAKKIK
jgi:ubiquinone/menaquinone biosynthesis C-methylase UbiE